MLCSLVAVIFSAQPYPGRQKMAVEITFEGRFDFCS